VTFLGTFLNPGVTTTIYQSPTSTLDPKDTQIVILNNSNTNFAVVPVACTMAALHFGAFNYPAPAAPVGPDTETVVVFKNQAATSMTCSVTTNNNGSGCADTTHPFPVVAGDTISLALSQTNAVPFNKLSIKLTCQ
jgi:hypothetical protein